MNNISIWKYNKNCYAILSKNPSISGKLNRLLLLYPKGTNFKESEALFFIPFHKKIQVEAIIKQKIGDLNE